jgi:hypothetical protein
MQRACDVETEESWAQKQEHQCNDQEKDEGDVDGDVQGSGA